MRFMDAYLLYASATVQLRREMHDVVHHLCGEKLFLNHGTVLKQLLYHIISKDIYHQRVRIDHDFLKHALPVIAVCGRNLFLEKPRTLLVTSKFNNSSKHVLAKR